jgi:hypothetical protein
MFIPDKHGNADQVNHYYDNVGRNDISGNWTVNFNQELGGKAKVDTLDPH